MSKTPTTQRANPVAGFRPDWATRNRLNRLAKKQDRPLAYVIDKTVRLGLAAIDATGTDDPEQLQSLLRAAK